MSTNTAIGAHAMEGDITNVYSYSTRSTAVGSYALFNVAKTVDALGGPNL
jgi:hypothetical protein